MSTNAKIIISFFVFSVFIMFSSLSLYYFLNQDQIKRADAKAPEKNISIEKEQTYTAASKSEGEMKQEINNVLNSLNTQ